MESEGAWQSWTGDDIDPPTSWGRTIVISLCAIGIGLCLTSWLDSMGSESFSAVMESHSTPVKAHRAGRLQKILIEAGETVQPGDSVLLLKDETLSDQITAKHQELAMLKAELNQRRAAADVDLVWRLKELNAELLATRLKIAGYLQVQFDQQLEKQAFQKEPALNAQIAAVLPSDDSFKPLIQESVFFDEANIRKCIDREAIRNAAEVSEVQIELCEERLGQIEALKARLPGEIQRARGVIVSENRLAARQQELSQLKQKLSAEPLKATAYGRIGHYRKQPGDAVVTDEILGEILDDDRRFLTLKVAVEKLVQFGPETEVMLEFPGGLSRKGIVTRDSLEAAGAYVRQSDDESITFVRLRIVPTDRLWPDAPDGSIVTVRVSD